MKTILVDAVQTLIIEGQGLFEEMRRLLDSYPNRKIVLTNANDEEAERFGLGHCPYEIFSLKHQPDKIDPEYYRMMLEHFGLRAEETVYFEHSQAAVKNAESLGIRSWHYDPEIKDLVGLKRFLDENL